MRNRTVVALLGLSLVLLVSCGDNKAKADYEAMLRQAAEHGVKTLETAKSATELSDIHDAATEYRTQTAALRAVFDGSHSSVGKDPKRMAKLRESLPEALKAYNDSAEALNQFYYEFAMMAANYGLDVALDSQKDQAAIGAGMAEILR